MADSNWWTEKIEAVLNEDLGVPREITDGTTTVLITKGRRLIGEDPSEEEILIQAESYPDLTPEQKENLNQNPMGDWLR